MNHHIIKEVSLELCQEENIPAEIKALFASAREAAKKAWAPFSQFQVGAALLLDNGTIVQGNNQENVAYPSGMCAERTALYWAGASFPDRRATDLALVALQEGEETESPATPCGACLQALWQYEYRGGEDIVFWLLSRKGVFRARGVKQFLPFAFESLNHLL